MTVLAVIAAILLGARDHPHQVAHPDRNPPVAEAVESGRWNPDLPRNDDLGAVGRFLARGKVHFAETVFTKDDENCGEIFATDVCTPLSNLFALVCFAC